MNFRLISGIIASYLEEFLLENEIINPSLQHLFSLSAIMDNATPTISLTFVDFRNAFGSVTQAYIKDILKLPTGIQSYCIQTWLRTSLLNNGRQATSALEEVKR